MGQYNMEPNQLAQLKQKACDIRSLTIDAIGYLGTGHIGGAMSIVDVLAVLYHLHMKHDPKNPHDPLRDKLVLSKGHSGPALYAALADCGYFPLEWLHTLNTGSTNLPSHCDMNKTPGIDMTTGSLGQGISTAIGLALSNRLDKIDANIFLVIGDGESNEGQIWEGAMAAAHYRLNKLIAFTDYNRMQIDGCVRDVMNIDDINAKWVSFGWNVQRVNGHDFLQLDDAIARAKNELFRPSMIIMDTVKGKGCSFAEGKLESHNMTCTYDEALAAIQILEEQYER